MDCEHAYKTIRKLEHELQVKQETSDDVKLDNSFRELYDKKVEENATLSKENKELRDQKSSLQASIKDQDSQMQDLQARVETSKSTYKGTAHLHPSFSSQLSQYSRSIFLSNSLPNLNSISWSKPCEDFSEEAEEALAQQYDRQVQEFYEDERERVRVARVASSGNIHLQPPDQ